MKTCAITLSAVTLLVMMCAAAHGGDPNDEVRKVPIEVFASKAALDAYPIEIGVPFPPGTLADTAKIRLLDPDGAEVPCQAEELSRYVDGSLRAALVVFIAPVSKEESSIYTVEFGEGVSRKASPNTPVTTRESLPEGIDLFVQEVGKEKPVFSRQTDVTIEESGPIRSVVLVTGRFGEASDAHSYRVRIHAYAGTSLVRLQHTVLSLDAKKPFDLAGWGLRLRAKTKEVICGVDGAARTLDLSKGERLLQNDPVFAFEWGTLPYEEGMKKQKKRTPFALGEMCGWRYRLQLAVGADEPVDGKADGWLRADTPGGSVTLCVRDFWQQAPKALSGDDEYVTVWLHSPEGKPFIARAGTAKTHEILLDVSPSGASADTAYRLNTVFQGRPHARVAPEWVCASGVFGPLLPRSDPFTKYYNVIPDICLAFIVQRSGHIPLVDNATWYLYTNADFGDVAKAIYNYNVPEEHTRGFMLEFLRGGDPEWARISARAARHFTDIDVCHADTEESDPGRPWAVGRAVGQRMPWPFHAGYFSHKVYQVKDLDALMEKIKGCEEAYAAVAVPRDVHQYRPVRGTEYSCHAGGALPYYLLTGDRRAREVLVEEAEWIISARKELYDRGSLSFQLTVLLDAHEATGDVKYLKGTAPVIENLVAWWKAGTGRRRDFESMQKRLASGNMEELVKAGRMLRGYSLPTGGFWELAPVDGRPAENVTRRARSAFRFLELNVSEADTGIDNEQVKQMLAECLETNMRAAEMFGCSPVFVYSWTKVVNMGLWSEDARREFEEKVLFFLTAGRKDLRVKYMPLRNGIAAPVPLKYMLPFLPYTWSVKRTSGAFTPFDVEKITSTYVGASALGPYLCHLHEMGLSFTLMSYPFFTTEWKTYHERYLAPKMNREGILEFTVPAAGEDTPKDE